MLGTLLLLQESITNNLLKKNQNESFYFRAATSESNMVIPVWVPLFFFVFYSLVCIFDFGPEVHSVRLTGIVGS